jgi:hypothetical protein
VSPASQPSLFRSFFLGGFECSTHRRRDGLRLDLIAATRHDLSAEEDYRQLAEHGTHAARDGAPAGARAAGAGAAAAANGIRGAVLPGRGGSLRVRAAGRGRRAPPLPAILLRAASS